MARKSEASQAAVEQTDAQRSFEQAAQEFVQSNPISRGRAGGRITLPNGQLRSEYIRRRFLDGVSNSDIRREIEHMVQSEAREQGVAEPDLPKVAYQSVYAVTKRVAADLAARAEGE